MFYRFTTLTYFLLVIKTLSCRNFELKIIAQYFLKNLGCPYYGVKLPAMLHSKFTNKCEIGKCTVANALNMLLQNRFNVDEETNSQVSNHNYF